MVGEAVGLGGGMDGHGMEVRGNSMCFPLNFSVNVILLRKLKSI